MPASASSHQTSVRIAKADTIASMVLPVETRGAGFIDITAKANHFVSQCRARDGVLTLFIRHTSASLTVQENADPSVRKDLMMALAGIAPEGGVWSHDTEGPDDMPAHVKTMLTATSLQVPVIDGQLALGTWQAIYLIEHRTRPHRREVVLQFFGAQSK
jgi:secondary thiamine-phosphate synthase enzyme